MGKAFNSRGGLNFPLTGKVAVPKRLVHRKRGKILIHEAYCPEGHSLTTDVRVDDEKGLHFIYTDKGGAHEAEIVISAFVGNARKKILAGKPFAKDEIVKVLCPVCRQELPVLFDCECGAPIYLFYIDKRLDHRYGQSFCSRIGCVRSSQLRFSQDALSEFAYTYGF